MLGFNRHALLADQYRRSVEQFRVSQLAFVDGAAERAALREARASAAHHRMVVRAAVGEFVRLLRDQGVAPELALVAVKTRLSLCVTVANPGAPAADANLVAVDANLWAIKRTTKRPDGTCINNYCYLVGCPGIASSLRPPDC